VKNQFEQEALPIRSKASEAFAATVQKSQELDVFNPCSAKALEMLRTKYKSDQFPKMGEETFELKPEDGAKMASIGQGLLTTIQPIPVISPERAAELKSNTLGVGKNVVDSRPRGEDPDTLPSPKSDPKPEAKTEKPKATATTKPAATPAKPSKNDDEPEDTL
jgi:hypothetical protein